MQKNDKPVLIYSTFPSTETAEEAGSRLVEARLAACVNIIPGMTSIYRWRGKIERGSEVVMIIKTRARVADAVMVQVKAQHPYTNPALLVLPVEGGSGDYLAWLIKETAEKRA